MAIRLALGETPRRIRARILGTSLTIALVGTACGAVISVIGLAAAAKRFPRSLAYTPSLIYIVIAIL
jgi:ABC-type antimicrobial peptide transport system permease subunit